MVRRIVLVLMVLLVLVTAAAVVAWVYIDHLAAAALTTSIEYLGEVECTVRDVSVWLLTGRIRIDGLVIRNPPGYASGEMLTVERADLHVRLGSLWNQPVHVRRLEVARPMVRVEAGRSGANVRVFLENVQRKIAVSPDDPPTRMWVDKLVIREASVRIGSGIAGPDLANVALAGPVEMTDIRGPNGEGVTSGELAAMVLFEVSCRRALKANVDLAMLFPRELIRGLATVLMRTTLLLGSTTELFTAPLETIFNSILAPKGRSASRPAGR